MKPMRQSRINPPQSRRQFLFRAAAFAASPFVVAASGKTVSAAEAFDNAVLRFMNERGIPGGALAVVKDRRLVHARGYGVGDCEKQIPSKADSLFRIASLSKPITAAAVLHLVEQKALGLDEPVFDLLRLGDRLSRGRTFDERWRRITVRHLLQHTGGWDRDKSGDPMFMPRLIARQLDARAPAEAWTVIRWMLPNPLDFDPGTRYAYSNFGYCLLGRVIERVTGRTYEKFVRKKILGPIGIRRMRIGASLESRRARGEVRYYTGKNDSATNVFGKGGEKIPWPYGGFHLEAMDAHGGWIASAVDLARFATALDEAAPRPLLKPDTLRLMCEPPAGPVSRDAQGGLKDHWYGCGWLVRPVKQGGFNLWHSGSLPGTATFLARMADGVTYTALFNQRSDNWQNGDGAIDPALGRAAREVTDWPKEDLFSRFA